jgi:ABC-type thiamine transport system ATPase subunit
VADRSGLTDACDGPGWVRSRCFRCLDFDWSLLTNDPQLAQWLSYLYEACVVGDNAGEAHVFTLRRHETPEPASVSLDRDGRSILRQVPPDLAIARLVWEVNRGVVDEARNKLLLHAAAAERDGRVVLIAGPEGSGKSTLVAALVRSGLRYMTDETVAVEVPGATIEPYPKPIALDGAALESLNLTSVVPTRTEIGLEHGLVAAQAIRADAITQSKGLAALVVFPTYRAGAPSSARSVTRAEAAIALADQAFNFWALGPGRLEAIAAVVRGSDCCGLDMGDVGIAQEVVLELFDRAVGVS